MTNGNVLTEDSLLKTIVAPLTLNRYNYAISNPVNYKDPGGHAIDTVFDIVSLFVSAVDFVKNPSISTGLSLAWDVFTVAVPGVPSVGLMDDAVEFVVKGTGEKISKKVMKEAAEEAAEKLAKESAEKLAKEAGETTLKKGTKEAAETSAKKNCAEVAGKGESGAKDGSFMDLMDPDEAKRYENYWKQGSGYNERVTVDGKKVDLILDKVQGGESTRQRLYTVPGERSIKDVKLGENGEVYIRETIFDEYGRRIGNNDYTNHGRPDISEHTIPHYHQNPAKNPSQHGSATPGLHPDTP